MDFNAVLPLNFMLVRDVTILPQILKCHAALKLTNSPSEAYKVFREIMQMYGGEDAKWDEALLDSARGSQVRRFTEIGLSVCTWFGEICSW